MLMLSTHHRSQVYKHTIKWLESSNTTVPEEDMSALSS
jgi:hypothetical protein